MRLRRIALTATTAGLLALAFAPSAVGKTAIMGSALNLPYEGGVCNNDCLSLQLAQVGGETPFPIVSPANGVLTEWKVRTGDPQALYTLRVMRPGGGNAFTAVASSTAPTPVPAGVTDSILTYSAPSLPIQVGDSIGLLQGNGGGTGADVGLPQNTTNGITANIIANSFAGTFSDGAGAPFIPDAQHELLLQATLQYCEVPKLKGKPVKKAKKALRANDCSPKVKKKDASDKKEGDVIKQKRPKGFTAAPGTKIPIVVGD